MTMRPTVYKPEFCDIVIELGRQGYSLAQISADERIDVTRQTLHEWTKTYPEFSYAINKARELSLAWWESQGMAGMWSGKQFNDRAYSLQIRNRFPDDYSETVKNQNYDMTPKVVKDDIPEENGGKS